MSAKLHREIAESKRFNTELNALMNRRDYSWGLINGQLVEFGRFAGRDEKGRPVYDFSRPARFAPRSFRLK